MTLRNVQPMLQLGLVLRGIKKQQGIQKNSRLPITTAILIKSHQTLDGMIFGDYEDKLIRAACSLEIFWLFVMW